MEQSTEQRIMQGLLKKDEKVFEELLKLLIPQIIPKVKKCNGEIEDAISIVHDAIITAIEHIRDAKYIEDNLIGYIYGIAANKALNFCRDKFRKDKRENTKSIDNFGAVADKENNNPDDKELQKNDDEDFLMKKNLADCLSKLSPENQKLMMLYYYEGLKWKDIADILGIKSGTVRTRASRLYTNLKDCLNKKLSNN